MRRDAAWDEPGTQGTLAVRRHLVDEAGEKIKQLGPRFGETSRSLPSLDPVDQALRRSRRRDGAPLGAAGASSVGFTELATRAQMQSLRNAGCMATATDWHKPTRELQQARSSNSFISTSTAFYSPPSASVRMANQMSRSFVNLVARVPVCSPEPRPTYYGHGQGRHYHEEPLQFARSSDTAFWPANCRRPMEGVPSFPLQRSMDLLGTLYDMRRVKFEGTHCDPEKARQAEKELQAIPGPSGLQEFQDEAEEASMLDKLLGDCEDSEAGLRIMEKALQDKLNAAVKNGGARHPAALQCSRNLRAITRKALLLHDVEARTVEYLAADQHRADVLSNVMSNKGLLPVELTGIAKFCRGYTHKGGSPAEADRIDYEGFVTRFKLPAEHSLLTGLVSMGEEAGEWWATACLEQATEGATYEQLQRLLDSAVAAGADDDHFKMHRARKLVRDRLADDVLHKAQARMKKDKAMAEKNPNLPPGSASKAADEIETDIKKATSQGVPLKDKRLVDAKVIASELLQADGIRKRMANREKQLKAKGK